MNPSTQVGSDGEQIEAMKNPLRGDPRVKNERRSEGSVLEGGRRVGVMARPLSPLLMAINLVQMDPSPDCLLAD